MAKVSVYNSTGKESGSIELSDKVFDVRSSISLIHQVFEAMLANARQPWADTKDKSEVRGGGKKPWKQKGTGRARHGSIRSPIWKGGGVTFGPLTARNYRQKINKKMGRKAVSASLTDKLKSGKLIVVDSFPEDGKTRSVADLRVALPGFGKTTLLVVDSATDILMNATKNVKLLDMQRAMDLNVADLMTHQYIVVSRAAVDVLTERLSK
jgi:large subunit ribosomal protein L4